MLHIIAKDGWKTVAKISTNSTNWALDEACDFAGVKLLRTEEDFQNGDGYEIDQLALQFSPGKKADEEYRARDEAFWGLKYTSARGA